MRCHISIALMLLYCALLAGQSFESDADVRWQRAPGLQPAPTLPAAMVAVGARIFLAHDASLDEYLPESKEWKREIVRLPQPVGSGVALCAVQGDTLAILRGGRTKEIWIVDLRTGGLTPLPPLPRVAGRGAALTLDPDQNKLYVIRGDMSLDCHRYDFAKRTWELLQRVGGGTALAAIGQSTGAVQYSNGALYVWPDHHIQRYDIASSAWLPRVHMSYGQRPWWDGSAWAHEQGTSRWIVLQGGGSRTLSAFDPEARSFAFLRPRLPVLLSGEGSRACIVAVQGVRTLFIYAITGVNSMLSIPLEQLELITAESPLADIASGWRVMHESAGSSLVRRNAPKPVLGLMGSIGKGWWYFGRLKNMRVLDPAHNAWTEYPGAELGKAYALGLCAAADGVGGLYIATGGVGGHFVMMDGKTRHITRLADCDTTVGPGSAAAFHRGRVLVLVGAGQRTVRSYDPAAKAWGVGPNLPAEAAAPGEYGGALCVTEGRLLAVCGTQVLRLDDATQTWARVATLPFALSADGGMAAADPASPRLVCIEGGGSRRSVALHLTAPDRVQQHLLPDAVSVPGARALIETLHGLTMFAIHRGHDTHEIWYRPLDELVTLDKLPEKSK